MMYYLWSKFQQIPAIFGGERTQKSLKLDHFMAAALPRNHLSVYNLETTNTIKMKLTTIMYLHETLHLL